MNKVCPSAWMFSWNRLFSLSGTHRGVRGPYDVMKELGFLKRYFRSQYWGKQTKPRVLWMYMKIYWLFFFSVWSIIEIYINYCMLGKILKLFSSWDTCQNALGQSDCRIFKSTIFPEENHEKVFFLVDTNSLKLRVDLKILGRAGS